MNLRRLQMRFPCVALALVLRYRCAPLSSAGSASVAQLPLAAGALRDRNKQKIGNRLEK